MRILTGADLGRLEKHVSHVYSRGGLSLNDAQPIQSFADDTFSYNDRKGLTTRGSYRVDPGRIPRTSSASRTVRARVAAHAIVGHNGA